MDVPGASLELPSTNTAQMDSKSQENYRTKAILVSTAWDSPDSDAEDEDNVESQIDDCESVLCTAFSQMSLANMESPSGAETEGNVLLDTINEKPVVDEDNPLEHNSEVDKKEDDLSESDDSDTSDDLNTTLDCCSEDEGEQRNVSADRGGGDADVNSSSDPKHQIIKVIIAPKKRERDPEAYKKWLKTKNDEMRKNREKDILSKLELQRQKELEEEQRKQINRKKLQEWMERKKQNGRKSATKPVNDKSPDSSSEHLHCDPDAKYKNWLLNVKKREEEKKLRDLTVKQLEQEIKHEKKKMSNEIYQQWLKNAKHKPKPVPLNQGPNTLRGTVSKLYVNPEPWKNNCD
uniref:Coiled-coil domain-containing protein n=1 Tax=Anopheles minimus TaxID=112268 RepID=A0A182WIV1_9DIPT